MTSTDRFLIKPPKPVSEMTDDELDAFVEVLDDRFMALAKANGLAVADESPADAPPNGSGSV